MPPPFLPSSLHLSPPSPSSLPLLPPDLSFVRSILFPVRGAPSLLFLGAFLGFYPIPTQRRQSQSSGRRAALHQAPVSASPSSTSVALDHSLHLTSASSLSASLALDHSLRSRPPSSSSSHHRQIACPQPSSSCLAGSQTKDSARSSPTTVPAPAFPAKSLSLFHGPGASTPTCRLGFWLGRCCLKIVNGRPTPFGGPLAQRACSVRPSSLSILAWSFCACFAFHVIRISLACVFAADFSALMFLIPVGYLVFGVFIPVPHLFSGCDVFLLGCLCFRLCLKWLVLDLDSLRILLFVQRVWEEYFASADSRRPWLSAECILYLLSCPLDFVLRFSYRTSFRQILSRSMVFVPYRSPFTPVLCLVTLVGSISISVWFLCLVLAICFALLCNRCLM